MADQPILTSPDGSTSFNIGSVMLADGVDYGMAGMFTNTLSGNAMVDGGQLGARNSPPRMFKFPIRLATVGNLTPAGVAKVIRAMAQNGAVVDLALAGVATANMVRFDVIDGRVRETQDVRMWAQAGKREGVVELDVQPYGYLPTWIILASTASVGLPGTLAIPGGSVFGDVPGLMQISVQTNLPSQQLGGVGTYGYDTFLYSFGNRAPAWITAASLTSITGGNGVVASLVGDAAAPASQLQRVFISPSAAAAFGVQLGYQPLLALDLNPTYFGRFRLHAWARCVSPSWGGAIPLVAEVAMSGGGAPTTLASGGIVASVGQPLTLASDGAFMPIPTGFGFYPLGDISVPTFPNTSFLSGSGHRVRLWGNIPSAGVATLTLDIGGLWLQSLEGAHGVITRDLQVPGIVGAASYLGMYPFQIDAYERDVQAQGGVGGVVAASLPGYWAQGAIPGFSLADRFRGPYPQVNPSTLSVEIMAGTRRLQNTYRSEILADTPKVWWRFNEPSGASVILDYSGNGVNGLSSNMLLGASSLLYGEPGGATSATGIAIGTSASIPNANAPRTIEAWYKPATYGIQAVALLGASIAANHLWGIEFNATSIAQTFGAGSYAYAWKPGQTYHVAVSYSGTWSTLYVNGQGLGTISLAAALLSEPQLTVGQVASGAGEPIKGGIDEVAVYASALSANRILAHYIAGRNAMGATSPPVYQQLGYAGVSVTFQPRFAFSKEI